MGHGTADPVGAEETREIAALAAEMLPDMAVELGFLEVHERTGPVLEVSHPEEVLKVTEAADAIFDVGFLQGR